MSRAYLYKGKKYSNDWFRDFEGNIFDGSLWDLLEAIADDGKTKLEQHTYTYFTVDGEQIADDNGGIEDFIVDDLIEGGYFDDIDITELPTEDDMPEIHHNK